MPSAITHALVGAACAQALPPSVPRRRTALLFAVAAAAPDLDVVAFKLGIPYGHWLGHRGVSHSLMVAALSGALVSLLVARWAAPGSPSPWLRVLPAAVAAVALHGLLDAATDAGRGIGLFIPFSEHRYFLPFRPIETASVNPARFFSLRGVQILASEARWVWVPVGVVTASYWGLRWWQGRAAGRPEPS